MKRWIAIILTVLAVMGASVYGIGMTLPVEHRASVTFEVPSPAETVWDLVTTVERFPEWRPDVDRVEQLQTVRGQMSWRETGSGGELPLFVEEEERPHRLVVRIGEGLPFGGTWTYVLTAADSVTSITITEDGEVYSPMFRFVSRFIMGHDATLNRYRDAVLRELG